MSASGFTKCQHRLVLRFKMISAYYNFNILDNIWKYKSNLNDTK